MREVFKRIFAGKPEGDGPGAEAVGKVAQCGAPLVDHWSSGFRNLMKTWYLR